jgi:NDP-sugar pyrophosphorylase family protein
VKKKIDLVILSDDKGRKIKNSLNNRPNPIASFNKINFLQYLLNLYSKYNFKKIYIITSYKSKFIINKYHKKRINFSLVECIKEKKN